jgi:hypothetical protein
MKKPVLSIACPWGAVVLVPSGCSDTTTESNQSDNNSSSNTSDSTDNSKSASSFEDGVLTTQEMNENIDHKINKPGVQSTPPKRRFGLFSFR